MQKANSLIQKTNKVEEKPPTVTKPSIKNFIEVKGPQIIAKKPDLKKEDIKPSPVMKDKINSNANHKKEIKKKMFLQHDFRLLKPKE